ncbi:MAG: sugar ABC transporter ATP-binding protein [Chloroflexota bacterium]
MQTLLELHHISKTFPGVKALDDVSFDVRPGEIHCLLGENGAGKSTLIKVASGVYQPDSGEIVAQGETVRFGSPRDAQTHGIATIYQELLLYPELSVAENIFMGHAPRTRFGAVDWSLMRQKSREILASLNIQDMDVNRKVGSLTVGNRQRVEIAKALSMNARVLIMDEPTASITETDVERLFETIELLKERQVGIVYISHRLNEVFIIGDRVTVLRDGRYIATKPVAETSEDDLVSMMVGRTIDNLFPKLETQIGQVVLEARNLTRKRVTHDVSFQLRAGEIVGMAGLVGSGRSEVAQAIFGFAPAHSGTILIDGKEVAIKNPAQAMRHGIAYVPEDRGTQGLIRPMELRENTSLTVLRTLSRATFINRRKEMQLAQDTIDKLRIRAYSPRQIAGKLSGGNQQKVVVGKWLAAQPRILIVDEPTRGIDVGAKAEIHRLMSELAQQGMAILMISSELPEILGMSDRILVMREGRIVAELSRAEATQENIGMAMMGNTTGNDKHPKSQMDGAQWQA